MKKALIVVIVFSLFVLTGFAACSAESGKSPQTFSPVTFRGSDSTTTAPFTVTTDEWIIDWSYKPIDPSLSIFSFLIYPRGQKDMFVEAILFPAGQSGSTYSYAGPGEYYIVVNAANIENWQITIKPPK